MYVNNTTCHVDIMQGVAYSPLLLLGFLLNSAALYAFIAKRDSWTDTHIYMLNLAAADLALILFLPFRIYDAFHCLSKTYFCTFLISTHYINMYASIMTSAAISVHRCVAVRFPLQDRARRKKKAAALAVCLTIWVVVVAICVLFHESNTPQNLWTCYERCKNKRLPLEFLLTLVFLGFFTPLLIIVFCSSYTICTLLKTDDNSVEKKNIIGIVRANMIVFIVCYTPIHTALVLTYYDQPPPGWQFNITTTHKFLLLSEWIATTNCCLDSISYYFLLKAFIHKCIGLDEETTVS
ncbi:G-protein coupled receptor 35 [Myripristis murdjan]|uniref:G-protein coupled receptor 35 n=1 Tax=Myripristis murdjan TaxID=586833 RepID=UPI0011762775|nr:G-protein coupled receptor 35-like [Myripristis murdjan]